jgi:hypothetical protein
MLTLLLSRSPVTQPLFFLCVSVSPLQRTFLARYCVPSEASIVPVLQSWTPSSESPSPKLQFLRPQIKSFRFGRSEFHSDASLGAEIVPVQAHVVFASPVGETEKKAFFFFLLVTLGFDLRASGLLGSHS